MRRKSERNKAKTPPVAEEEAAVQPQPQPQQQTPAGHPRRGRGRPSRRRRNDSSTPEEEETEQRPEGEQKHHGPNAKDDDKVWHVKASESSGDSGEIGKLKICLSRPSGGPEVVEPRSSRRKQDLPPEPIEHTPRKSRHRSRRASARAEASEPEPEPEPELESVVQVKERTPEPQSAPTPPPIEEPEPISKVTETKEPREEFREVEEQIVGSTERKEVNDAPDSTVEIRSPERSASPELERPVEEVDQREEPQKLQQPEELSSEVGRPEKGRKSESTMVLDCSEFIPEQEKCSSEVAHEPERSDDVTPEPKYIKKITLEPECLKEVASEPEHSKELKAQEDVTPQAELCTPEKKPRDSKESQEIEMSQMLELHEESEKPKKSELPEKIEIATHKSPAKSEIASHKSPAKSEIASQKSPAKSETASQKSPTKSEIASHKSPGKSEITSHKSPAKSEITSHKSPGKPEVASHKSPGKSEITSHKSTAKPEVASHKSPGKSEITSHKSPGKPEITSHKSPAKPEVASHKSPAKPEITSHKSPVKPEKPVQSESRKSHRRWSPSPERREIRRDRLVLNGEKAKEDRKISEESKENSSTANSSSRKRKWGSRPKLSKQPSVNISTDSLKSIIPKVEPVSVEEALADVKAKKDDYEPKSKRLHSSDELKKVRRPLDLLEDLPSVRKISIVHEESPVVVTGDKLLNPPSPPKHKSSAVLYITNLVRPFTLPQLKNLLQRTGRIVENGFWIDKIKSKCYVQYENEDEAIETRHALHGVTWPVSNPKTLNVDFGSRAAMDEAIASTEEEIRGFGDARVKDPQSRDIKIGVLDDDEKVFEKRTVVREWDLGKGEGREEYLDRPNDRHREVPEPDRRKRRSKSRSPSPARKFKKKEEEAPSKLLDDLFKKTKTTPCIYWLPLDPEVILIKEEQRRKHMAEHERHLDELRKAEEQRKSRKHHSSQHRHR